MICYVWLFQCAFVANNGFTDASTSNVIFYEILCVPNTLDYKLIACEKINLSLNDSLSIIIDQLMILLVFVARASHAIRLTGGGGKKEIKYFTTYQWISTYKFSAILYATLLR